MAKLIYSMIGSLDGYIADSTGNFTWAEPDEEVHTFINDLQRPVGTHLCGRRLYEVMTFWESDPPADAPAYLRDFAGVWQSADKVVYSRTLRSVSSVRTRIAAHLDPAAVRAMKAAAERDLSVGGPELAAQVIRAGLVDEYQMFLAPIAIGAGTPALPVDVRLPLELLAERRFASGMVFLHYRARSAGER